MANGAECPTAIAAKCSKLDTDHGGTPNKPSVKMDQSLPDSPKNIEQKTRPEEIKTVFEEEIIAGISKNDLEPCVKSSQSADAQSSTLTSNAQGNQNSSESSREACLEPDEFQVILKHAAPSAVLLDGANTNLDPDIQCTLGAESTRAKAEVLPKDQPVPAMIQYAIGAESIIAKAVVPPEHQLVPVLEEESMACPSDRKGGATLGVIRSPSIDSAVSTEIEKYLVKSVSIISKQENKHSQEGTSEMDVNTIKSDSANNLETMGKDCSEAEQHCNHMPHRVTERESTIPKIASGICDGSLAVDLSYEPWIEKINIDDVNMAMEVEDDSTMTDSQIVMFDDDMPTSPTR